MGPLENAKIIAIGNSDFLQEPGLGGDAFGEPLGGLDRGLGREVFFEALVVAVAEKQPDVKKLGHL
jgi:hypothetical protein